MSRFFSRDKNLPQRNPKKRQSIRASTSLICLIGDPSSSGDAFFGDRWLPYARSKWFPTKASKYVTWFLISGVALLAIVHEGKTSMVQARLFSYYAGTLNYSVQPGPSPSIVFPVSGPFNQRHGYTQIPDFQSRLEKRGFEVIEQTRFSPQLAQISRLGITPPYRGTPANGLVVENSDGSLLYQGLRHKRIFDSYEQIPKEIIQFLVFIENRELGDSSTNPNYNPALEWDRLAKASLTYAGNKVGIPVKIVGGSTLATQLEKYRYSNYGRTNSLIEKLRQITGATLKAYRNGPDTQDARKEIILEYLNSMPLSAVPHFGEVNGLGDGLYAWFGIDFEQMIDAFYVPSLTAPKLRAIRAVLSLLCAVKAPNHYLALKPEDLDRRVDFFIGAMKEAGLLDPFLAEKLTRTSLKITPPEVNSPVELAPTQKALNAVRLDLSRLLAVNNFYALDRLDLDAKATLDGYLQQEAVRLLANLKNDEFIRTNGLRQERLLSRGDPDKVIYSFQLFETMPIGNVLRVQVDTFSSPLDINDGIKLELGSTAKLRTLAHYLEIITSLYAEKDQLPADRQPLDPITQWSVSTLKQNPQLTLEEFIDSALKRKYSASPREAFFTGGGLHTFSNFDSRDDGRILSIKEATRRSTNLVYIRLIRDLVRFHQARLPYDAEAVLSGQEISVRQKLLQEASEEESRQILSREFRKYSKLSPNDVLKTLLGRQANDPRSLAILYFAWHTSQRQEFERGLSVWLEDHGVRVTSNELQRLIRAYSNPRLNLLDFGYLLKRHPLELWCARELWSSPMTSWEGLWGKSEEARKIASAWLFNPRNRKAQNLRLRTQIEQDAFSRMTPYWQRLGFPFEKLVPSYATAIGSSSDRPAALARLMGIILNDGFLRPEVRFEELRFAEETPYHTVLQPILQSGQRVMQPAVARAIKSILASVVQDGTARRLAGVFRDSKGNQIMAGGKTGSGDNRFKAFGPHRVMISSTPVNRTATFVFYVGDRYYGVITASVMGKDAENYSFTSALPVAILKLLAPALSYRISSTAAIIA